MSESSAVVAWGWAGREGLAAKEHKGIRPGDRKVLYLDRGVSYMDMHICQNSSNCALKMGAVV